MIRYVRVDYAAPHRPGIPVIVCEKNGKIVFERSGMEPTKKDARRARVTQPSEIREVQQNVHP